MSKASKSEIQLSDDYEMPQLGSLPQEWQVVRLGEVAYLVRGISWSKKEQSPDGIPVIAIPNIREGRVSFDIRYKVSKKVSKAKQLHESDILLVGSSGSPNNVGRTAIVQGLPFPQVTFASFLIKLIPSDEIERDYIYYLLGSQMVNFVQCSKRAADGKYNLQVRALKEHPIPLPPLPEQRAIAHVLRKVQEAKEATERVIAALRELKKSLMRHLFTYGPVPVGARHAVPLRETEIGPLPAQWQVVRLGEVVTTFQYGLSVRAEGEGTYPMLRMNNLEDGRLTISDLKYVSLSSTEATKFLLRPGDLLFNRTNSRDLVGKTALFDLDGKYVFASYLIRMSVDCSNIETRFLNFLLNYAPIQQKLKSIATRGVSQANISASKLKAFVVPLPPLPEQREIARLLQAVDREIEAEEARQQALEGLFKSMLHHLMTAKVRLPKEFVQSFGAEDDRAQV